MAGWKPELDAAARELKALPAETPLAEFRTKAQRVLALLSTECANLERDAAGYPASAITANVWVDGITLWPLAASVATQLKDRGLFDLEDAAHVSRCRAVLAVQSHYHSIVGPAMLARADCNERLGNTKKAAIIYDAVIADFSWLADEYETETRTPKGDDRCSIGCLSRAVEQRLQLAPANVTALKALHARCETVLARK